MKTFIIIISILCSNFTYAQKTVEKTANIDKGKKLDLDFKFADKIHIKTWDKQEVYVKATVNINNNQDNDHFILETKEGSNGVEIKSGIKDMEALHNKNKFTVRKDEEGDYKIDRCNLEMHMDFEVSIPKDISLNINTINGDIYIADFNNQTNINTISGFIDMTLASSDKVNIDLKTISGGAYTDLDLDFDEKDKNIHRVCGTDLKTSLNGGGESIKLKTISGDIFLRKQ